tara:strand:- start:196 stop:678 length:483 start_codon:yes stop_codon:yes gene_type:complete
MRRYLSLLLFIGLAWGQHLKLANTEGDTVLIKQGEKFVLDNGHYTLKKVDYQNRSIIIKGRLLPWILFPYSAVNLLYRDKEIRFDSIRSLKYIRNPFNIMGILIGGGFGGYLFFYTNFDYNLSEPLGAIFAGFGITLSITEPTFSKKIILNDDEWSIVID